MWAGKKGKRKVSGYKIVGIAVLPMKPLPRECAHEIQSAEQIDKNRGVYLGFYASREIKVSA